MGEQRKEQPLANDEGYAKAHSEHAATTAATATDAATHKMKGKGKKTSDVDVSIVTLPSLRIDWFLVNGCLHKLMPLRGSTSDQERSRFVLMFLYLICSTC